jgi:hypothetical protein
MITQQWAPSPSQPAGDGTEVEEYWPAVVAIAWTAACFRGFTGADRLIP